MILKNVSQSIERVVADYLQSKDPSYHAGGDKGACLIP